MTIANAIAPSPVSPLRMTEAEYLAWVTEDMSTEWVAGEVVFKMPISEIHDLLQAAIRSSLEALVRRRGLGQVRGEKWAMRLPDRPSWREADVVFIATENAARLSENKLVGPADVAIEIISPDSMSRDYRVKYFEYESAGVREYWIVNPIGKSIEAHLLNAAGKYEPIKSETDGKLSSTVVPGWWLSAPSLFKEPTPDALELMQQLGIVAAPAS